MKFVNRETQFPEKRKLIKVDENNIPIAGELPILVNIVKDEGTVYKEGTPINADSMNKSNWRDDRSVSFRTMESNDLPDAKANETQIVTKANGETWIIPPLNLGEAVKVADSIGTTVKVFNVPQNEIFFNSDPQKQITHVKEKAEAAKFVADTAHTIANGKAAVKVNGILTNVDFRSDPQIQIDSKANLTGGTVSDPADMPMVTSLDGALALISGKTHASRGFSCFNTGDMDTPFPEASPNTQCMGVISRAGEDASIHLRGSLEGITLNAYRWRYSDGVWRPWTRPKGWAVVWGDRHGSGCRQTDGFTLPEGIDTSLGSVFKFYGWFSGRHVIGELLIDDAGPYGIAIIPENTANSEWTYGVALRKKPDGRLGIVTFRKNSGGVWANYGNPLIGIYCVEREVYL